MKFWNWSKDRQIQSALKLQELVKEGLKEATIFDEAVKKKWEDTSYIPLESVIKGLQSLVEESEK